MSQMSPRQKLYKGVEAACCNFLSSDHLKRVRSPQEPSRGPEEAEGAFQARSTDWPSCHGSSPALRWLQHGGEPKPENSAADAAKCR